MKELPKKTQQLYNQKYMLFQNTSICKLMYFINVIIGDKNHELAFVQCYGNPEKSEDNLCKFVFLNTKVSRLVCSESE
jgi:hypothetical protein